MKTFLVIGLGKFGASVARELCRLGHEVLAIDRKAELVEAIADKVTYAVTADASDPAVLAELDAGSCDCAVVAIGMDVGSSALITLSLKELGLPKVVCKAGNATHRRVLEKVGADRVIIPEQESGVKLAQGLVHSNLLNFIEFSEEYGIVELTLPPAWQGKTLKQLDVRAKYHVTVIAVRESGSGALCVSPGADYTFQPGDCPFVLGTYRDINRLEEKG